MNAPMVDDLCAALLRQGFQLAEAESHPGAFGSWFVTLVSGPRVRAVWDGKDGWLIVQRETRAVFNGPGVWEDLWIERDPGYQTADAAADAVRRALAGERTPSRTPWR